MTAFSSDTLGKIVQIKCSGKVVCQRNMRERQCGNARKGMTIPRSGREVGKTQSMNGEAQDLRGVVG